MTLDQLKFDANGLIPAVVQDYFSKKVLTVAYMNRESLEISIKEGKTCFYSRSRQTLWRKGETSGTTTLLAAIIRPEVFQEGYEKLAESTMEVTSFENTRVEGSIDCAKAGLMYTSIPQDGNWTVTVDGQPAEITLVGNVMIGVKLDQGQHNVVFHYHNRAFSLGWKISLGCAAIFAVIIYVFYPPARKRGKFETAK